MTAAFLLVAGFTAKAQTTTPATDAAVSSVVYVNSDSLVNNYEYYKVVRAKMQDLAQRSQTELETKGKAFQTEVAAYQKSASSLTPAQKAATEKRLQKKQQDLQLMEQNSTKQLQDIQATQTDQLYDRIAKFLKTYTKQKGYKIVLTYSRSNPSMLFGDESLDVTKDVVAGLNEEYKKGQ